MILSDGRILDLFKLVTNCIERIQKGEPDIAKAVLAELKEEIARVETEITPR